MDQDIDVDIEEALLEGLLLGQSVDQESKWARSKLVLGYNGFSLEELAKENKQDSQLELELGL